jgi:hypothetical protein
VCKVIWISFDLDKERLSVLCNNEDQTEISRQTVVASWSAV